MTRSQYIDIRDLVGGVRDGFFEGVEYSSGINAYRMGGTCIYQQH